MTRRRWISVAVLGTVAVAAGVAGGQVLVASTVPSPAPAPPRPAPPARSPGPPAGFVEFRDELFSIAYPAGWTRQESRDPEVEVLATGDRSASFLVRVVPLNFDVGPANVGAAKRLTDKVVKSGRGVKLIAPPQRSDLGGLPGYFYLYSYRDGDGRRGAHSHYFLFKGDTMFTIVFQAVPADRLPELAQVFDRIARTFRPS